MLLHAQNHMRVLAMDEHHLLFLDDEHRSSPSRTRLITASSSS
jgi:hypothetical protein